MSAFVVATSRPAKRTRSTGLSFTDTVATRESSADSINREERRLEGARPRVVIRTAERYWLLLFAGDELRFTRRATAELWAAKLTGDGIASQLIWHDESTPANTGDERQIA